MLAFIDNREGKKVGADVLHKNPAGHKCSCWIKFAGRSRASRYGERIKQWGIVCEVPLTLSPDIVCPQCGDRGLVRDGMWEPMKNAQENSDVR